MNEQKTSKERSYLVLTAIVIMAVFFAVTQCTKPPKKTINLEEAFNNQVVMKKMNPEKRKMLEPVFQKLKGLQQEYINIATKSGLIENARFMSNYDIDDLFYNLNIYRCIQAADSFTLIMRDAIAMLNYKTNTFISTEKNVKKSNRQNTIQIDRTTLETLEETRERLNEITNKMLKVLKDEILPSFG